MVIEYSFDDGFLDAIVAKNSDPRFIDAKYGIFDLLQVDEFPIGSETIRQLSKIDAGAYQLNPDIKIAILANKLVVSGLAHMFKMFSQLDNGGDVWEMKLFENENQAREWLGIGREHRWLRGVLTKNALDQIKNRGW